MKFFCLISIIKKLQKSINLQKITFFSKKVKKMKKVKKVKKIRFFKKKSEWLVPNDEKLIFQKTKSPKSRKLQNAKNPISI